jgi:hypothetical protein
MRGDFSVAGHALDSLLVVANIGGGLSCVQRHLVAEFLGALAFKNSALFTSTEGLVIAGGLVRWRVND